jgi:flagellar assembly factor FliW
MMMMTSSSSAAEPSTATTAAAPNATVHTLRFGEVIVGPQQMLNFVSPILGFEDQAQFALLPHEEDSPFQWLQALQNPALAFVVTQPALFGMEYSFDLSEAVAKALSIESADDLEVFTLVTIPDDAPHTMTTNLLGPIVWNRKNNQAMQVVLEDAQRYPTKVRLIPDEVLQELEAQQANQQGPSDAAQQAISL